MRVNSIFTNFYIAIIYNKSNNKSSTSIYLHSNIFISASPIRQEVVALMCGSQLFRWVHYDVCEGIKRVLRGRNGLNRRQPLKRHEGWRENMSK